MTERAKQFIDALRSVAHEHNQSVQANFYQIDPSLWPFNVRIGADGVVRHVVIPGRVMRGTIRAVQGWEGAGEATDVVSDEQIAGPNFVLSDEIPAKSR